ARPPNEPRRIRDAAGGGMGRSLSRPPTPGPSDHPGHDGRDDPRARRAPPGRRPGHAPRRGRPGPRLQGQGGGARDGDAEEELPGALRRRRGEGSLMADPLPAGRELDALVAEKVMGWVEVKKQPIANAFGQTVMEDYVGKPAASAPQPVLVPRFSTMIQE